MISKLSKRIVRMLYAESMLEIEDVELYEYGFYVIFTHLLFFCFSAICGLILGVPLEAVLFYVAFPPFVPMQAVSMQRLKPPAWD